MTRSNDIVNELKELNSRLADMPRHMPYYVPQGYFEVLNENVLDTIRLAYAPEPTFSIGKNMPFEMPQGYFESLAANVLNKAASELPIDKPTPYTVPAGYFENLPQQVLQRAKDENKQTTKIIPLGNRIWKNVRWAAAAVLMIGLGLGGYNIYNNQKEPSISAQLAALPQDAINDYIVQHIDEFDTDMLVSNLSTEGLHNLTNEISEQDILNYLDESEGEQPIVN